MLLCVQHIVCILPSCNKAQRNGLCAPKHHSFMFRNLYPSLQKGKHLTWRKESVFLEKKLNWKPEKLSFASAHTYFHLLHAWSKMLSKAENVQCEMDFLFRLTFKTVSTWENLFIRLNHIGEAVAINIHLNSQMRQKHPPHKKHGVDGPSVKVPFKLSNHFSVFWSVPMSRGGQHPDEGWEACFVGWNVRSRWHIWGATLAWNGPKYQCIISKLRSKWQLFTKTNGTSVSESFFPSALGKFLAMCGHPVS